MKKAKIIIVRLFTPIIILVIILELKSNSINVEDLCSLSFNHRIGNNQILSNVSYKIKDSLKDISEKNFSLIIKNIITTDSIKNNYYSTAFTLQEEKIKINNPTVYIYNTHQTENYADLQIGIIPSVKSASYLLQNILEINNIHSIVEEKSVSELLSQNNWNYSNSYKITRKLMEQAKIEYPSLKYFIDVHRDSVSKTISTIDIENKKYAKVLFILGLENTNYEKNLNIIEHINNEINNKYSGLSRGIYKKSGPGVNGIYNQDFDKNVMLIEIGGYENNMSEVANTVEVVGTIMSKYMNGDEI